MNQGALANVKVDEIIERIAAGEYQSHIAREYGVAPQSLHERIHAHPGYKLALRLRNLTKLDEAQERVDTSPDLARAREQFRAAAWRAERECPDVWGQQSTNISVQIDLGAALAEISQSMRERVVSEQHQELEHKPE
jgi:hypothetical protein